MTIESRRIAVAAKLVNFLVRANDQEIAKLERFANTLPSSRRSIEAKEKSAEPKNLDQVVKMLISMNDREAGREYLISQDYTRKELESLARKVDVHFLKSDKVEALREKIVQNLIGARLSSKAIIGKQ